MKYKLFLDDVRTVLGLSLYNYSPIYKEDNWKLARNFDEFKSIIIEFGMPSFISFDHDLGDIRKNHVERTGYDCAKWLVNYCMDNNIPFPEYKVHSDNTVGKDNITYYIENYKKIIEKK